MWGQFANIEDYHIYNNNVVSEIYIPKYNFWGFKNDYETESSLNIQDLNKNIKKNKKNNSTFYYGESYVIKFVINLFDFINYINENTLW